MFTGYSTILGLVCRASAARKKRGMMIDRGDIINYIYRLSYLTIGTSSVIISLLETE